jgi:hypothetical protein
MSSDSWLFVNDNPDSLAQERPNKLPARAVKAHVQNVIFRKKQKERIDRLKRSGSTAKPIVARSVLESEKENKTGQVIEFGPILTPNSISQGEDNGEEEVGLLVEGVVAPLPTKMSTLLTSGGGGAIVRRRSPAPGPLSPFGAERFDPFATFPIKLHRIDDAFLDQCQ